jgi:predicted  nucleic acid-binding Zn-ribbon protein
MHPVATPGEILREIHRLRRHAKDLQEEIDRGPRQLQMQQNKVKAAEEARAQTQEAIKKLKVDNHEREVTLKATSAQIDKHERQLNECSSKKEYDALKSEIAADKAKCQRLEDEILRTMIDLDEKSARLPELEKTIQKTRSEAAEFERTLAVLQAERSEMLQQAQRQLQEAEASLPEELRVQYDRLVGQRGEDALALVQGTVCTACYTGITAQSMNELRIGRFVVCKNCGRILYLAE